MKKIIIALVITALCGLQACIVKSDYTWASNLAQVPQEEEFVPEKGIVIGNSITLGFGSHGMASSDVDTDYYYLLYQHLQEKNPDVFLKRIPGYHWESGKTSEERLDFLNEHVAPEIDDTYDFILIQLGDNVNTPEKKETFSEDCKELLVWLRKKAPKAKIMWVFGRYNLNNATGIRDACSQNHAKYVDISVISTSEKYMSKIGAEYVLENGETGIITNGGVASHPNDEGMKVIFEKIAEAMSHNIYP